MGFYRRHYGRDGLAVANAGTRPVATVLPDPPTCVACRRPGDGIRGPLVEQGRCDQHLPLMWHVACAPDREAAEADLATLEDAEVPS